MENCVFQYFPGNYYSRYFDSLFDLVKSKHPGVREWKDVKIYQYIKYRSSIFMKLFTDDSTNVCYVFEANPI